MKPLSLLCVSTLLLAACSKPAAPEAATKPAQAPVSVELAPVQAMELQRSVRVTGSLVGLETATLSNRVAGRITKIYADRGDRVKPGEKLLEIEPVRFRMGVDESRAALEQVLARLGLKEVPPENFDVNQTAPVKKAKAEYDIAKEKMDRSTPLNKTGAMNDLEYLDIVATARTAESTLENSRDEARALLAQARQNAVQVSMKQQDFDDAVILAPDGTTPDNERWGIKIDSYAVTDRKVSVGEYIREGSPLFSLVADSTLKLQAHVPERYLGDVKQGAEVTFNVAAYGSDEFIGKVAIIDPAVDQANRTFLIEAVVNNTQYQNKLRPGSFVQGFVLTKKEPNRVMVPQKAITSFVGVTKVFKLDGNKVRAITVTTGQQEDVKDAAGNVEPWTEIISMGKGQTLAATDQVVVAGLTKLVDGSPVTVGGKDKVKDAPATAQAAAGN